MAKKKGPRKRRKRGDGTVEPLPSGSFRAVLPPVKNPKTGRRFRPSKTFPTEAEAEAWRRENLGKKMPGVGTLDDWLTTWLELHKTAVATRTHYRDAQLVRMYLRDGLGSTRLRDLTPLAIKKFLGGLATAGVSSSEREKAGATLRKSLNAAVESGQLPSSPMAHVKLPKVDREEARVLDGEQLRRLLATAGALVWADPAYLTTCVMVWVDTCLRPGEMLGLQWQDFELSAGTLFIRRSVDISNGRLKPAKTKKSRRRLPLSPPALEALRTFRPATFEPTDPIFATPEGLHWWHSNFRRDVFNPLVAAAAVDASPYTLRHTGATLLLQAGVPIKVVADRLGHENPAVILKTYAHVLAGDQEKAASAMGRILEQ